MKAKKIIIPIVVFIVLAVLVVGGLFVYRKYIYKDNSYVGKWTRQVDITEQVKDRMDLWLDTALKGDYAEYGDDRAVVTVTLYLNADGSWTESFDETSYAQAEEQAINIAAKGLTSFLEKRLESAEVTPDSVGKTVDELIQEAIGMSPEEYLRQYGPKLLPDVTEYKSTYAHSGGYTVKDGILARTGIGSETIYEIYSVADGFLLISGKSDAGDGIEVKEPEKSSLSMAIDDTPAASTGNTEIIDNSPATGIIYPLVYTRQ